MALVAYYPLNGDAKDYSGNEYNGVVNGGSFVEGKVNQAFYSNINTDRIDVSTNNLIPVFSETFSVSFWYKMDSRDNIQKFLVTFGSSAANSLLHIVVRTSNILAFAYYSNDFETTYEVPEKQWVHIVCVGNKTEMKQKVYINGKFFAERQTTTWLNPPTENLVLGNRATDFPAKGVLDEVRIYDHALSEFEIRELALFRPSANLVAHYPLDGDAIDYSGNNNHGVPTNITFGEGKIKQAGVFNNSVISIDTPKKLPIGNEQRTITSWIKLNSTYNNAINAICTYGTSSDSKNFLFSIAADRKLALYGHSSGDTNSELIVPLDKWVFVSVIYDGAQIWFYLDGVFSNKISKNFNTILDSKGLNIGRHSTAYPFYGKIDDLRIYNKALSESEIKSLAQAKVAHYKLSDKIEQATQNLFYNKLKPTENTKVSRFGKLYGWELTGVANDIPRENLHTSSITLEPSTFYTISAIYYSSNGVVDDFYLQFTDTSWPEGGVYFQPFVNSQASQVNGWSIIKSLGDNWFYLIGTFQTFSTTTAISTIFWDSDTAGQNIFISNLQLEKGKAATPITKNTRQGPIIKDSTYNHNHGSVTLATSPKWSSDTAVGLSSMEFDGIDDAIKIPEIQFTENMSWTASLWVKRPSNKLAFVLGNVNSNVESITWGGSGAFGVRITGGTYLYNDYALSLNTWHCIIVSYNNGNFKFYHNGQKVKEHNNYLTNFYFNSIGNAYPSMDYLHNGKIADVQIFATALSDNDIYDLYTSKSKSIKFNSNSTSKILQSKDNKTIIPFTTVGTTNWTCPAGVTKVDALIVAGGGGGGHRHGAGGGAGGLLFKKQISVVPGTSYPIIVGAGGAGSLGNPDAQNGGNSSAFGFTAIGGGRGGEFDGPSNGLSGGSGGGSTSYYGVPGAGTDGQGYAGSYGYGTPYPYNHGAGGGAGGPAIDGTADSNGHGGPGKNFSISFGTTYGENGYFAGGGGGGSHGPGPVNRGLGGIGGGGDGGVPMVNSSPGQDAMPNTGGGGGGAATDSSGNGRGGNGGSGIVLIKYSTSNMNSKITK